MRFDARAGRRRLGSTSSLEARLGSRVRYRLDRLDDRQHLAWSQSLG